MRTLLSLSCLALVCVGCGSAAEQSMGSGPIAAPWPALETFEGDPMLSLAYPHEMGDIAGVKRTLTSQSFADALAAFEASPLPSDYSGKQAQKDAMIKAFRDAIEAAKSGAPDMNAKAEAALKSMPALRS